MPHFRVLAAILLAFASLLTADAGPLVEGVAGDWRGSLQPSPVMELRLALEIHKSPSGKYAGKMVSLDQSPAGIPISELTEMAGAVAMKFASIGGAYEGKLNAEGSELTGTWQQSGMKLPLVFKRVAEAPTLLRPQDPRRPYPYAEQEVTVNNNAAGIKLAGTFTLPAAPGLHPAVVLITGSGPQDRDESLMGHRPFLVLADHLTRSGIAVLRCDDRGVGRSTGSFSKAVTDDFAADTLAAVAWLRARPEIDPRRIGLLGHSEGGLVAPLAAVQKPADIAFIVLLAGLGVPMEDLLLQQSRDLARVMGASEEIIAKNAATQRALFSMVRETPDDAIAEKRALEIMHQQLSEYTPEQREALGFSESMLSTQSKMVASPWFRRILTYDPQAILRQVKCPVLALNGEKDLQVAARENLAGIRDALTAGGHARVKIVALPGLNHLFQTCTTGAVSEYGRIEETIAPAVLALVSDWIREQTGQ